MTILLLEDDVVLCDVIDDFLSERYEVVSTFSSDEALIISEKEKFDLFIFDINVVGSKTGIGLLGELRAFNDNTPAIIITAYTDISHLKQAFGSGANDFIKKPFELAELAVRIENIKKTFNIASSIDIDGETKFFPQKEYVEKNGRRIRLSPKDASILHYFVRNPYRTISNEELSQNIWDFDTAPSEATIRSHIRTIREIIGKERIKTLRGIGYIYE